MIGEKGENNPDTRKHLEPIKKMDTRLNDGGETRVKNPKREFETMIHYYMSSPPSVKIDGKTSEVEVRFGTNAKQHRAISKMDYENVVGQLIGAGFSADVPEGTHILRIANEYKNEKSGVMVMSNTRAEIVGVDMVQEYCRTNSIQKVLDMPSTATAKSDKIKFTKKTPPPPPNLRMVDFPEFSFRVSHQMEQDFSVRSPVAKTIIEKWNDAKKNFRYINRVRFSHPTLPIFADISIVRSSSTSSGVPIPQYTIQEAKVLSAQEKYEIELEIDNMRVGPGTNYNSAKAVIDALRKTIRVVLSGIQCTNYPISAVERNAVINAYYALLHGKDGLEEKLKREKGGDDGTGKVAYITNRDFIGPSSFTLQMENIVPETVQLAVPNIRKNYCVTDKADGERRLLYISEIGNIYMINMNMQIIFSGAKTDEKTVFNSLLDGEFIKYDKTKKVINLYAAFDIYYVNGKSVREFAFMKQEETDLETKFRLSLLQKLVSIIGVQSILDKTETGLKRDSGVPSGDSRACRFVLKCKDFYATDNERSIFRCCDEILTNMEDNVKYEYNTDGIIFTPINTGVGSAREGVAGPLHKATWDMSFKWKPVEYNTIDFLVNVKKNPKGQEEIHNIYQDGVNLQGVHQIMQYKTLELMCGFNQNEHVFANPFADIVNNRIPETERGEYNPKKYEPRLFVPTSPFDPQACYCNVFISDNGNGVNVMRTEEGEFFEGDTIVEFRYDETKEGFWKWIPMRVRHDKTYELRTKKSNFGNAYHVANSNWKSIHNPITRDMLMSGNNIPEINVNDDVYYNRSSKETSTKPLRDFHNLVVKRRLILAVANRGDTLIDYAVGKAGDLPKWIDAKLKFVFGIDISRDNIHNNLDGACARYLVSKKRHGADMPSALFLNGNSGLNIRSGDAYASEKDKEISLAVFGEGPKDRVFLGEGVYMQYGTGRDGFNISSLQFAIHYFFETEAHMHQLLRNISECTRVNGHFIGTCYDGETVFQLLKKKNAGESITIMKNDKKMYEITKQYSQTGFPNDETTLGYAIDIYQETINKTIREYLVSFPLLVRMMENYGFVPLEDEEAKKMGFPSGSGMFENLYEYMQDEIRRRVISRSNYGEAPSMSEEEKRISFMNRYFVFKKIRNVNTDKIFRYLQKEKYDDADEYQERGDKAETGETAERPNAEGEKFVFKIKRTRKLNVPKVVIKDYSPIIDEPVPLDSAATPEPEPESTIVRFKIKKPAAKPQEEAAAAAEPPRGP
jgi:hypothetical protein